MIRSTPTKESVKHTSLPMRLHTTKPSIELMYESNAQLIARLIGGLLAGIAIIIALHFAFSFTWLQSFVLAWLYCLLKSEVETIANSVKK